MRQQTGIEFMLRCAQALRQTATVLEECGLTADAHVLRALASEHTRWVVLCLRGHDMRKSPPV